jgi:BTB/POZ domain-containing protein 3/6
MASNKTTKQWKQFSTIRERMNNLFNNEIMADIVFRFGPNQKLMAHKLILSSGSQVFHQLFYESIDNNIEIQFENNKQLIEFFDCEFFGFKLMVKYLYSDEIEINDNNVLSVIQCSKKFKIQALNQICVEFIVSKLSETNCLKWWQQLRHRLRADPELNLVEKCAQMIASNALNVFKGHEIINLTIDEIIVLFRRNDLNISEFELFKVANRWAIQECIRRGIDSNDKNLRQTLGLAFDLIRFPIMSSEEFGKIVATNREMFDKQELVALISYINSGLVINNELPFLMTPRISICGDSLIPKRPLCSHCIERQILLSPESRSNYFNNSYYNQYYYYSQQPIG